VQGGRKGASGLTLLNHVQFYRAPLLIPHWLFLSFSRWRRFTVLGTKVAPFPYLVWEVAFTACVVFLYFFSYRILGWRLCWQAVWWYAVCNLFAASCEYYIGLPNYPTQESWEKKGNNFAGIDDTASLNKLLFLLFFVWHDGMLYAWSNT